MKGSAPGCVIYGISRGSAQRVCKSDTRRRNGGAGDGDGDGMCRVPDGKQNERPPRGSWSPARHDLARFSCFRRKLSPLARGKKSKAQRDASRKQTRLRAPGALALLAQVTLCIYAWWRYSRMAFLLGFFWHSVPPLHFPFPYLHEQQARERRLGGNDLESIITISSQWGARSFDHAYSRPTPAPPPAACAPP